MPKKKPGPIRNFLDSVAEYQEYGADFRLQTGCAGQVIVCVINDNPGLGINPMELVCMGWEEAHAMQSHWDRDCRNAVDQCEALELTPAQYLKLYQACYSVAGHNKKLRADLLSACGLEEKDD